MEDEARRLSNSSFLSKEEKQLALEAKNAIHKLRDKMLVSIKEAKEKKCQ
jgi:hypothetical protein